MKPLLIFFNRFKLFIKPDGISIISSQVNDNDILRVRFKVPKSRLFFATAVIRLIRILVNLIHGMLIKQRKFRTGHANAGFRNNTEFIPQLPCCHCAVRGPSVLFYRMKLHRVIRCFITKAAGDGIADDLNLFQILLFRFEKRPVCFDFQNAQFALGVF